MWKGSCLCSDHLKLLCHTGFQKTETVTENQLTPKEDVDDDIPLAQLVHVMESQVSMDEYLDIYIELTTTEEVTDELIFNNLIEAR